MPLVFERLDRLSDLDAIEGEWRALFEAAGQPSPFLQFDWVRMCFARRLADYPARPEVGIVRHDGALVLALPLHSTPHLVVFRRLYGLRTLMPQYTEALVAPGGDRSEAITVLVKGLRRLTVRVLALNRLREASPLRSLLAPHAYSEAIYTSAAVAELPDGYEAYFDSLGRKARWQARRMLKGMSEIGEVSFRLSAPDQFDTDLDWLLTCKRAWTPKTGELRPWLQSPGAEDDLRHIGRVGVAQGWVWLAQLEIGGRRAASCLAFTSRTEAVFYAIAHDPEFAEMSPGRTLVLKLIEYSANHGRPTIDFMAEANPMKERLKTGTINIFRQRVRLS